MRRVLGFSYHKRSFAYSELDYLTLLLLHAETNDIKSQTPVEILGDFERVKDMIAKISNFIIDFTE